MVIPLRTSMTAEDTRTPLPTARLQFLPLQVPLPRRDHPGVIVKEMSATGIIAAVIRIFQSVPLGILHSAIHGHASFLAFFHYFILLWVSRLSGPEKLPWMPTTHAWNQTII